MNYTTGISKMSDELKIKIFDLETMASRGRFWARPWETSIISIESETYLLSGVVKDFQPDGNGQVREYALPQYHPRRKKPYDDKSDKKLTKDLIDDLNDADLIVAHNGNSFDVKVLNTRAVLWSLPDLVMTPCFDTKTATRKMRFLRNSLDYLGDANGLGRKKVHTGFDLWLRCEAGEHEAWVDMMEYNIQDVNLLEEWYAKVRQYAKHPNIAKMDGRPRCPSCNSSKMHIHQYKTIRKQSGTYIRYRCAECGSTARGKTNQTPIENRRAQLVNE